MKIPNQYFFFKSIFNLVFKTIKLFYPFIFHQVFHNINIKKIKK